MTRCAGRKTSRRGKGGAAPRAGAGCARGSAAARITRCSSPPVAPRRRDGLRRALWRVSLAYDNHYWVAKIGDPGFKYHALMAQLGAPCAAPGERCRVAYSMETYARVSAEFVRELDGLKDVEGQLDRSRLVEGTRPLRRRRGDSITAVAEA